MKGWRIDELGDPWSHLKLAELPTPEPGPHGLAIDVAAADLNFADILQCQGRYQVKLDPPFVPGMYSVGQIYAIGDEVDARFAKGQTVIGPTLGKDGAFAEQAVISAGEAYIVPADVDPVLAVASHVTYGTAWFGLHQRGHLRSGETVLVLAAAGGVGSAAVELAKHHGCWVIAAAGGPDKAAACKAFGADEVVDYDGEDLYQRVMDLTDGRGVDVVYDPVGGKYFEVARRLVAWEGRLLVIGFASGDIPSAPANHALVKNYSIVGVHMGGYRGRDNATLDRCYDDLHQLMQQGRISPLMDSVVGMDELPGALQRLANRQTTGRVVFRPGPASE